MDSEKEGKLIDRIAKHIDFREGGDYFAFDTVNMRNAEIQDITKHEFWGLVKEVIAITEYQVKHDANQKQSEVEDGK